MHAYIEAHMRGEEADLSPFSPRARAAGLIGYIRWRRDWLDHHQVTPLATEQVMVSERHQYGGTPDLIARVDGVVTLLDWKTSKQVYVEHLVQTAAYAAMAWEHRFPIEAIRVLAISTEADGEIHETSIGVADARPFFEAFLAALRLHRRQGVLRVPERVMA